MRDGGAVDAHPPTQVVVIFAIEALAELALVAAWHRKGALGAGEPIQEEALQTGGAVGGGVAVGAPLHHVAT